MCCSVLQCVVVCVRSRVEVLVSALTTVSKIYCSVLQCVAVCCSVLRCVAVCWSVSQFVVVCCGVLQCVAVCCSVLQCVEKAAPHKNIENHERRTTTGDQNSDILSQRIILIRRSREKLGKWTCKSTELTIMIQILLIQAPYKFRRHRGCSNKFSKRWKIFSALYGSDNYWPYLLAIHRWCDHKIPLSKKKVWFFFL